MVHCMQDRSSLTAVLFPGLHVSTLVSYLVGNTLPAAVASSVASQTAHPAQVMTQSWVLSQCSYLGACSILQLEGSAFLLQYSTFSKMPRILRHVLWHFYQSTSLFNDFSVMQSIIYFLTTRRFHISETSCHNLVWVLYSAINSYLFMFRTATMRQTWFRY